jgi:fructan beta-fructosidase
MRADATRRVLTPVILPVALLAAVAAPLADSAAPLAAVAAQGDQPQGMPAVVDRLYQETYRPQFHFTPKENWTNDPNGLVYYKGEYHLFFQHNPLGINWGNMTWGHAVSKDLVHWQQLDHAIRPDALGTIFSGSAVVDQDNTAGFQTGEEKVIVAIFTYAGAHAQPPQPFTQGIAYSNDRGRTFTKYEKNPVVSHFVGSNRDPKVIWHEPTGKWVMALYLDRGTFALLGSKNLKQWQRLSDVGFPDGHECPELFELPLAGDKNDTRWVFSEGGGRHMIGRFDGTTFTPERGVLPSEWGSNCYAGQTYNNIPESDGRRIFIAWMSGGKYPGMPFNQQMTFPRELTLRTTDAGVRLFAYPVREIEKLYTKTHRWASLALKPGQNPLAALKGELWDLDAVIEPAEAEAIELNVRGQKIRYDVARTTLSCMGKSATVEPVGGRIELRLLVDRTSIEIFANRGRIVMSFCFLPNLADRSLGVSTQGGEAKIVSLTVRELESAWPRKGG